MAQPKIMGRFTPIGMRTATKSLPADAVIINTCAGNDTAEEGTETSWVWCNPTNRAIRHQYEDIEAVSVESLWQGTKILRSNPTDYPDARTLAGEWRRGKGKAPRGAYAGTDPQTGQLRSLITAPGEARRRIYIPAFRNLIEFWLDHPSVSKWVEDLQRGSRPVFLRDHDTGRGVNRNGPLSHAWVLAYYLNEGQWPQE